jgi:hypothetical protein
MQSVQVLQNYMISNCVFPHESLEQVSYFVLNAIFRLSSFVGYFMTLLVSRLYGVKWQDDQ